MLKFNQVSTKFILLLILFRTSFDYAQTNRTCIETSQIRLLSDIKIWSDDSGFWLRSDIEEIRDSANFKSYKRNFFVHNSSKSAVLHVDFECPKSSTDSNYLFVVGNPDIDYLRVWLFANDSLLYTSSLLGLKTVNPKNGPPNSRGYEFQLKLLQGIEYSLFVGVGKENYLISSPLNLLPREEFNRSKENSNLKYGILFGSFFGFIIISLFLYFMSWRIIYLYYSFYILSIVLMLFGLHGFAYQYLLYQYPSSVGTYSSLVHLMGLLFLTLYAFNFMQLPEKSKWLQSLRKIFIVLYCFGIFCVLFKLHIDYGVLSSFLGALFSIVQLVNFLFLLIFPIANFIRTRNTESLVFFLSYLPVGLSLIYVNLSFVFDDLYYLPIMYSISIASLAEVLILSAYMAYSFRKIENDKLIVENRLNKAMLNNQLSFFTGQEDEKKRMALALHDNVGASLLLLRMKLENTNEDNLERSLPEVNREIELLSAQIRNLSHDLLPLSLKEHGLIGGLRELCNRLDTTLKMHFSEEDCPKLSENNSLQLYRIFQELLKNTLLHSGAKNVYIQFFKDETRTVILYEEDGKGCDLEKVNRGLGLYGIETRCQLIEAQLRVETSPGRGFNVYIELKN